MLVAAQAGRRVKKRRMKIVRKIVAVAMMMMMKKIFINLQLQTTIKRVKVGQLKFELKNKNSDDMLITCYKGFLVQFILFKLVLTTIKYTLQTYTSLKVWSENLTIV